MKIYDFDGKKNISGDRIRECRAKRHMSQQALAAQMQVRGITIERNCISRIETGARFVADYELKVLSEIFKVSTDWLTGKKA